MADWSDTDVELVARAVVTETWPGADAAVGWAHPRTRERAMHTARAVLSALSAAGRPRDEVDLREVANKVRHLNRPMVARLQRCAADTSPNWDGAITVYPPEARGLVDLIDATSRLVGPWLPVPADTEETETDG